MKLNSSFFLSFLLVIASFSSIAQYKYDLGLRVSSHDLETFQFDARHHLKSPYSIVVSLKTGSQHDYDNFRTPIYEDSLISYASTQTRRKNFSISAGIQRRLGLYETDVFYASASLGIGYQTFLSRRSSGIYLIDSVQTNPYPQYFTTDVAFFQQNSRSRTLSTELILSFGMDVPISKRFVINAEIGLQTAYRSILNSVNSYFDQHLFVSGGLRYSFCEKRE